jgi:hypothetical protein
MYCLRFSLCSKVYCYPTDRKTHYFQNLLILLIWYWILALKGKWLLPIFCLTFIKTVISFSFFVTTFRTMHFKCCFNLYRPCVTAYMWPTQPCLVLCHS